MKQAIGPTEFVKNLGAFKSGNKVYINKLVAQSDFTRRQLSYVFIKLVQRGEVEKIGEGTYRMIPFHARKKKGERMPPIVLRTRTNESIGLTEVRYWGNLYA